MPRPTDVVFRNYKELTWINPEDILPPLPYKPTYPKKLLVNLVADTAEGSCEYWLLESGKTVCIPRPPVRSATRSTYKRISYTPPQTPKKHQSSPSKYKKVLSPIKIFKSKSPSKPLPTPPLSPAQSICHTFPRSPPSSRFLKFWKKRAEKVIEDEELDVGSLPSPGAEFERTMWKTERAIRPCLRPSEKLIDPEDEDSDSDFEEGLTQDFSARSFITSVSSSQDSTASLFSSPTSSRFPSYTSLKYCHSRSRSSSMLAPIKEINESFERPYSPLNVISRLSALTPEVKHKCQAIQLSSDCPCPIFDYQFDSKYWEAVFEDWVTAYLVIVFRAPWVFTEYLIILFSWVPFFRRVADYIIANGGGTFLFLLSNLGFGLAALPIFLLSWPTIFLHDVLVYFFRRIPWYNLRFSIGCPYVKDDD